MSLPQPEDPGPEPTLFTRDALQAAVILVTAATFDAPVASVDQLLDGADPRAVAEILSIALSSALRVTLGVEGRSIVLQHLGLKTAGGAE
ncbi:hypothetical protein GXW83_27485 [Streptacidiphilus sp. PB12-B1b]|uniref:hypothetical protein n=1 Tax=Streptacidiphilus sp. PB12-B1b TaxID=2705012 RepID=UPI0015FACFA0|nr:hypothetical protein [Streptacidiphilus sp. PB12-B1b]QMU78888.1 hypothetical protein GXW83_27485 [Streptacidiphilus sp. PB12-B1b]